jgi:hypothetical protein
VSFDIGNPPFGAASFAATQPHLGHAAGGGRIPGASGARNGHTTAPLADESQSFLDKLLVWGRPDDGIPCFSVGRTGVVAAEATRAMHCWQSRPERQGVDPNAVVGDSGSPQTIRPRRGRRASSKAGAISSARRTSSVAISRPRLWAESRTSLISSAAAALSILASIASRPSLGSTSRRTSRRLAPISVVSSDRPVMFAPGRGRLATRPVADQVSGQREHDRYRRCGLLRVNACSAVCRLSEGSMLLKAKICA